MYRHTAGIYARGVRETTDFECRWKVTVYVQDGDVNRRNVYIIIRLYARIIYRHQIRVINSACNFRNRESNGAYTASYKCGIYHTRKK